MTNIELKMQSGCIWDTRDKAEAFADILARDEDFLLPEKFDEQEPERKIFDPKSLDPFVKIWTSDRKFVILKRKKPHLTWYIVQLLLSREYELFNELVCGFDERYMQKDNGAAKLLDRARAIYSWGRVIHGHICHEADWNRKNYFGQPTVIASGKPVSTGGLRLKDGLPGIYWANFFGPLYVEFIGEKKFRTVPAYHKEVLDDGGYLIITAESPEIYDAEPVNALQKEIIAHIGNKFFFEKTKPKKKCKVPGFDFEA